ncbi:MAG: DNA cytosine methyltransferase [Cyanobacteria bacterium P01_F01_bin.150]
MTQINTLGLFSGGGGLDLGFSAAGFHLVLSSDIDSFSCKTLEQNQEKKPYLNKHPVLCQDVRQLSQQSVKNEIGHCNIDFIIGGPPCQAFSIFGRRKGLEDPRGGLVFEYARIINEIKPEAFIFENVTGLKTIHNGNLYQELLKTLSLSGEYTISDHEYELAEFGVPQFRRRLFFIGTRSGKKVPKMFSTHSEVKKEIFGEQKSLLNDCRPFNTVQSALSGLPKPITDWKKKPPLNGHVGRKHSERIVERYHSLSYGERDPKTRINKLNPDRPSFTIIVGSDAGGGKGHVHPYDPREVTPRESARIQTFPDWWDFHGTGRHVIRQVGNAVPPLFAGILARYVSQNIFNTEAKPSIDELIKILELNFLSNGNKRSI